MFWCRDGNAHDAVLMARYNAVRDLARHMTCATQVHYDTMLRMMKYVDDMNDRGLIQNPTRRWNGNKEHEFIISG